MEFKNSRIFNALVWVLLGTISPSMGEAQDFREIKASGGLESLTWEELNSLDLNSFVDKYIFDKNSQQSRAQDISQLQEEELMSLSYEEFIKKYFGAKKSEDLSDEKDLNYEEIQSFRRDSLQRYGKQAKEFKRIEQFTRDQKSLIDWEQLQTRDWLDYGTWLREQNLKVEIPDWELRVRELRQKETMGRILSCVGECRIYRGKGYVNASFRSSIKEGDDLETGRDSYAWVFLMDGTMVRISPRTSISFKEINIGIKENFLHVRLNDGNIFWYSRSHREYIPSNLAETDSLFLPLRLYEANPPRENQEISEEQLELFLTEDQSVAQQFDRLNTQTRQNNQWIKKKPTYSFIVLPNGTIFGKELRLDLFYQVGGVAYIKNRSAEELSEEKVDELLDTEKETTFYFRGYNNKDSITLKQGIIYQVDSRGRELIEYIPEDGTFALQGLLTKRIPTILLAREFMLEKYSKPLFQDEYDIPQLAKEHGYRLWGRLQRGNDIEALKREDLELRLAYLKEHSRRIETSGLLAKDKYLKLQDQKIGNRPKWDIAEYSKRAILAYLAKISSVSNAPQGDQGRKIFRYKAWWLKFAAGNP